MTDFESRLVVLRATGSSVLVPVSQFGSCLREEDLEREVVAHPELLGEELLVLGSQLAEFTEDRDRLDVLAIDREGELVLVELKADETYRVTDLQALAYAGAYAVAPTDHLARTLRRTMERARGGDVSLEEVQKSIISFVEHLESFDEWEPSRRVRIKLVAPQFPQRVLTTVKWLADEYGMPVEAIQVHLYETDGGATRHLTFERLLPLRGDEDFGMTTRAGRRVATSGSGTRRRDVLRTLVDAGELADGSELWFLKTSHEFPAALREDTANDDPSFRVQLSTEGTKLRFQWLSPSGEEIELSPSGAWRYIVAAVAPKHSLPARPYRSVHRRYSRTPGGETLGQLAERLGLWASEDEALD